MLRNVAVPQGELNRSSSPYSMRAQTVKHTGFTLAILVAAILVQMLYVTSSAAAIQTENQWNKKADMPTARTYLRAAVVNGKIYALGGTIKNQPVTSNEQYDPTTNTWVSKKPMPAPLSNFAIGAVQNKIYCISGVINEVYNPSTNTWEIKTPMPTPRSKIQASIVDGKIYIIGGLQQGTFDSSILSTNEIYDPMTDSWSKGASVPKPVADYASAVVDDKIYIITDVTQVYNTKTNSWTTVTPIPVHAQREIAAATIGAQSTKAIYVMGGVDPDNPIGSTSAVQVYFPKNNTWSADVAKPKNSRAEQGIAVVNDIIYLIGGGHNVFVPEVNWTDQFIPLEYGTPDSPRSSTTSTETPVPTTNNPQPTSSIMSTEKPATTPTSIPTASPTIKPTSPLTSQPTASPSASPSPTASPTPEFLPQTNLILIVALSAFLIAAAAAIAILKNKTKPQQSK